MSDKKSDYVLKAKYNGIPLGFGSNVFVTNEGMTNELAEQLISNHPLGENLFDKVPDKEEVSKSMSRDELDEIAESVGLTPDDYKTKKEIAKAINELNK